MKKQLMQTTLIFICFIGILAVGSKFFLGKYIVETDMDAGSKLVLLNEIEQLVTDAGGYDPAQEEIAELRSCLQQETAESRRDIVGQTAVFYLCFTALCLFAAFSYIYMKILRPFFKLEKYADRVAGGDFDFSLEYERTNFFGAFTWAFDHMREEITAARKNEMHAINENKTIIATLSHDIKTPIASVRAYAEGLEANLEADYEQRERYLQVIMKKCDEVSRLVNDLVLHSLSELEKLEIKEQKIKIRQILQETLQNLEYSHISLKEPVPEAELFADRKRLEQALLNLLENAGKYAPGAPVEVWAALNENRYEIHVRDYGKGILPEDMPFVMQKFYRGKNASDAPGSGLGLYIVSYIMEKMKGGIVLENHKDGLEAVLWLPLDYESSGNS